MTWRNNLKKIEKLIMGAVVLLCAGVLLLCGCGEENREEGEGTVTESAAGKAAQSAAKAGGGNILLPALKVAEPVPGGQENPAGALQDLGSKMMVRIMAGNLIGSGIIVRSDEEELWIATAGHVLAGMEDVATVEFRDGYCVEASDRMMGQETDLAILKISRESLLEEAGDDDSGERIDHGLNYCSVLLDQDRYDAATAGDRVIAMGSYTGVGEDAYAGILTQEYVYAVDFEAHMMLAQVPVKPGMSGGGLFDEQGYLLGILCGSSEDGEVAAAPLIALLAMLE